MDKAVLQGGGGRKAGRLVVVQELDAAPRVDKRCILPVEREAREVALPHGGPGAARQACEVARKKVRSLQRELDEARQTRRCPL